ncbi:uncharacterized protein LOC115209593 [Argonauta hians]
MKALNPSTVAIISQDKLVEWFRKNISSHIHSVKDLAGGFEFCKGMFMLFPYAINTNKIKSQNLTMYDRHINFKQLQGAFTYINLNKEIPIQKLMEGNLAENYHFGLWFKAFYELHCPERKDDTIGEYPKSKSTTTDDNIEYETKKETKPAHSKLNKRENMECGVHENNYELENEYEFPINECKIELVDNVAQTDKEEDNEIDRNLLNTLTEDNRNLTKENNEIMLENKTLSSERSNLEFSVNLLLQRNEELENSNSSLLQQIENLEEGYLNLSETNKEINMRNRELQVHYEDLNLHSQIYKKVLDCSNKEANLFFNKLQCIDRLCRNVSSNRLRKLIISILNETKYNPTSITVSI